MRSAISSGVTVIRGRVCRGLGKCAERMARITELYREKTGILPFPGTLNLELSEPFDMPRNAVRIEGSEYGGSVSINIVHCDVNGRPALLVRTDNNENGIGPHPKTIVEIAAAVGLRHWLGVSDGDEVEVTVKAPEGAGPTNDTSVDQ